MKDEVIGIFCADLHLSLTPPPLRSKEPDWFAAMHRPIDELKTLQENHHGCSIFCAGDIFDKWNSSPELINWAIRTLPSMHCIPGQHDMPEHDPKQMERSAYTTLMRASTIDNLTDPTAFCKGKLIIWPYPFGTTIEACPTKHQDNRLDVALIHEYNWIDLCNPAHANNECYVSDDRSTLATYTCVVSGDNHVPFEVCPRKTHLVNCGSLMLRKSNDEFSPGAWLLQSDGTFLRHKFDTSQDHYLLGCSAKELEEENAGVDLTQLMETLEKLGECSIDFVAKMTAILRTTHVRQAVESLIQTAMEDT